MTVKNYHLYLYNEGTTAFSRSWYNTLGDALHALDKNIGNFDTGEVYENGVLIRKDTDIDRPAEPWQSAIVTAVLQIEQEVTRLDNLIKAREVLERSDDWCYTNGKRDVYTQDINKCRDKLIQLIGDIR